jgi:hypothetical protein
VQEKGVEFVPQRLKILLVDVGGMHAKMLANKGAVRPLAK